MKKLLILTSLVFMLILSGCSNKSKDEPVEESKVAIVENGVYDAPKSPSDAQATQFNKLKDVVNTDNTEGLAKEVAINFCFDFFTLKNKESAADVGGLTYLNENNREAFKIYASNAVYKEYQAIVNEHGKSSLPRVKKVDVNGVTQDVREYTIITPANEELGTLEQEETQEFNAYIVSVTIAYDKTDMKDEDLMKTVNVVVIDVDGNGRYEVIKLEK